MKILHMNRRRKSEKLGFLTPTMMNKYKNNK
jgi:hypothetical protein